MSDKNTAISIYKNDTNFNRTLRWLKRGNALTDQLEYKVDGVRYFEYIDIDTANGNFGRSTTIEKMQTKGDGTFEFVTVTNKDELEKLSSDPTRSNVIGNHLKDLLPIEGAEEAFIASDMLEVAQGDQSWVGAIDLPPTVSENENVDNTDNNVKVEPSPIFGADMFKLNAHLKYPIDMFIGREVDEKSGGSQDYIFIEQFLYRAPQPKIGDYAALEGEPNEVEQERKALLGDILEKGMSRSTNLGDPKGSCILPIPNRLGVSQGVNWGEGKANAVELGAFQAVTGATKNLGDGLVKLIRDGYQQGKSVFNKISQDMDDTDGSVNAGRVINAVVAKSILGRIGINVDTEQFITRETGAAINPNLELLFGGPQLRTFSFVFNFAPNSRKEAIVVRKIQRWFRQGMLPQKTTNFGNGGSLFLGSPNVFRVCYKNNKRRIKGLNTFKICACTSVEVDFTPDGIYQSYEDLDADDKPNSMPVRSSMKVTFNELTPIFANDYNYDVNDDSLTDLGDNIKGDNKFTEDDLGF